MVTPSVARSSTHPRYSPKSLCITDGEPELTQAAYSCRSIAKRCQVSGSSSPSIASPKLPNWRELWYGKPTSLVGGIASGSSPEVIPLRPSQEAAGSVFSITVIEISARPSVLIVWTLAASAAALAPAPTTRRSLSLISRLLGRREGRGFGLRGAARARFGDHQPLLVGAEGDRAFPRPLAARLDRSQLGGLEDDPQHPLHLHFRVAGGEAATDAAAERDPGVGAGLPADEALRKEAAGLLVEALVAVDQVDAGGDDRPRRQLVTAEAHRLQQGADDDRDRRPQPQRLLDHGVEIAAVAGEDVLAQRLQLVGV